jgi:hypothetical protein
LHDTHEPRKLDLITELKSLMREGLDIPERRCEDDHDPIIDYSVLVASYLKNDDSWKDYIQVWEHDARCRLEKNLGELIDLRKQWFRDGCGVGISGSLLSEMLHHSKWAAEKCSNFTGRSELLNEMLRLIYLPNRSSYGSESARSRRKLWAFKRQTTTTGRRPSLSSEQSESDDGHADAKGNFEGINFAVIGSSGSGKTSLMAKLAAMIFDYEQSSANVDDFGERLAPRPVILRFCGSSAGSTSGLSLVCGIITHIRHVLDVETPISPKRCNDHSYHDAEPRSLELLLQLDYDAAVAQLHKLLRENAVVLLIDSVDQLSDDYLARSRMSFLDGIETHPQTRIVISALPDERDPSDGSWIYCYQCHTRCLESMVPIVDVQTFTTATADVSSKLVTKHSEFKSILSKILEARERCLTERQWGAVLQAARAEPSALYATLVARRVEHWASYDEDQVLQPTVRGLLQQGFDDLEREFGTKLTRTALGLITFSVSGLTDNEIEDLLSMDDAVLSSVFQYSKLNVQRLPSHVWLRLRGAMKGLLVERTGGCLGWYHRQLWETAVQRYSDEERVHLHALMGTYFSDTVPKDIKESRKIASQPLTYTSVSVFFVSTEKAAQVHINNRRVTESLHHLVRGDMFQDFIGQIRNVEVIFATITWGNPFQLISELSAVKLKLTDPTDTSKERNCMFRSNSSDPLLLSNMELLKYVDHYLRWFQLDMTAIISSPDKALFTTVTGSLFSVVVA